MREIVEVKDEARKEDVEESNNVKYRLSKWKGFNVVIPACVGICGALSCFVSHVVILGKIPSWYGCGLSFTAATACYASIRIGYKMLFDPELEKTPSEERLLAFLGAMMVASIFIIEFVKELPLNWVAE